tara:strand:+ start:269 stop:1102 length:834 start_codon:yes stop_codon:yes gene_type:complete
MSIALITRHLNEPFLDEFVEYYLREGIDRIFILQDKDGSYNLPFHEQVSVMISNQFGSGQMKDVNALYQQIRFSFKWFLFLDCDEFMSTVNEEKNKTLKEIIHGVYDSVDCIAVPWVMMSCNGREHNPPSLLQYNVHRWNHDQKHPHPTNWNKGRCRYDKIEVKCIFKGCAFGKISIHHPGSFLGNCVAVNSVDNKGFAINPFFKGFHEKEIEEARILCFHYRIMSKEACATKYKSSKLDGYKKSNMDDLWVTDYSEIQEEFMKNKSIQYFGVKMDV